MMLLRQPFLIWLTQWRICTRRQRTILSTLSKWKEITNGNDALLEDYAGVFRGGTERR